jgi:hypothetical protein
MHVYMYETIFVMGEDQPKVPGSVPKNSQTRPGGVSRGEGHPPGGRSPS